MGDISSARGGGDRGVPFSERAIAWLHCLCVNGPFLPPPHHHHHGSFQGKAACRPSAGEEAPLGLRRSAKVRVKEPRRALFSALSQRAQADLGPLAEEVGGPCGS